MSHDDDDNSEDDLAAFRACMSVIWMGLAVLAAIYVLSFFLKVTHP